MSETAAEWSDVGLDEVSDVEMPAPVPLPEPSDDDGFIAPVAMEADPTELFHGDMGTLDAAARVVLVDLLRRRFLSAEQQPARWAALLEHQQVIESRLHDLFVTLVVDRERGIAFKRQVRTGETDIPILLRDEPYTRIETVLLVHLRTLHQRERGAGETAARIDAEELEQQALSFLPVLDTNVAGRQHEIKLAVQRLVKEGFLTEETPGRFRIMPLVEVVLPVERLAELSAWLKLAPAPPPVEPDDDPVPDEGETAEADDEAEAPDEPDSSRSPTRHHRVTTARRERFETVIPDDTSGLHGARVDANGGDLQRKGRVHQPRPTVARRAQVRGPAGTVSE